MKRWNDVKKNICSLTDAENEELDMLVEIIVQIKSRRTDLGISQRELAEISGLKQAAIARLEAMGAVPQIDTLAKVLKPLGLKLCVKPSN
ncbi:MAG: helix-turn-helix transcriptional regulator [Clostridia bacterium]|nr:helix-turn-helix transcriptional regulator [Clostridia bacterium]